MGLLCDGVVPHDPKHGELQSDRQQTIERCQCHQRAAAVVAACLKAGQFEQALANYEKAYRQGQKTGDTNVGIFQQNYERMKARVHIMLKAGVLDPQGEAVRHALGTLGFDGVEGVRQGKVIELDLAESDAAKAEASVQEMCEKLLANTVIESYRVEMLA